MVADRFKHDRLIHPLCFGTAQLGMAYGAANVHGMPNEREAVALVKAALQAGISCFDTAQAYGESEARLGSMHDALRTHGATIITKLAPLEGQESRAKLEAAVKESVLQSIVRLGLNPLPYLLLHRAEHIWQFGGALWEALKVLKAQGLIERLGVSVTNPVETQLALDTPGIECIQLPYNILDGRLERTGLTAALAKRKDLLIMARSALLQGVLTQEAARWPVLASEQARAAATMLDAWVRRYKRESRADLCLAYARGQGWIDAVVVGMETMAQLRHNLHIFELPALSAAACEEIRSERPELADSFLNPALWPQIQGSR